MTTLYFKKTLYRRKTQQGQIMALFAVFLLFIVVGIMALAIDFGFIYHSKAKVSRTVDSIAIRIVNRYSRTHTSNDRERIAQSIFEANFGIQRSATTVNWAWTSNGGSVTSTSGETLTGIGSVGGDQEYKIVINTVAEADTGVVISNVTATALHRPILIPSFFKLAFSDNPSYASQYEKFSHTESAEAERFPSVNAIIVDLSGSMRNNRGARGISGDGSTDGAVVKFIESFDEERDYMLLIGFANGAKVLWPPEAKGVDSVTGLPFFKPSRFYSTRKAENQNITIEDIIQSRVAYTGWTNGAEGLRVAAKNIQLWLNNEPALQNTTARKRIKVNYVFMTDGENNTIRTYVRGYGHGVDDNGNGNFEPPVLSIHNTFHAEWPLVVRNQADIAAMSYDGEILGTLLNGANIPSGFQRTPENVAGVASNLTEDQSMNDNRQRYAVTREASNNNFENWTGLLIKETGGQFDGRWATNLTYNSSINTNADADRASGSRADYALAADRTRERGRIRTSRFAQIPRTLSNYVESDFMNPGIGHNYYQPASSADNPTVYSTVGASSQTVSGNRVYYITRGTTKRYYFLSQEIYQDYKNRFDNICNDAVKMTNERCQYVPMGEVWANHQGSYLEENGQNNEWNPTEALTPWIYLANSSNNRRTFVTQRITDFYPTYSFDGPPKEARWSGASDGSTDHRRRSQRRYYSWKDGGGWRSCTSGIPERDECDFLLGAQAQILRQVNSDTNPFKWQDATIYTIRYGNSGNSSLLREMANDPDYSGFDNTENQGLYYDVSANSSALVSAFQDIANRIAVRISR